MYKIALISMSFLSMSVQAMSFCEKNTNNGRHCIEIGGNIVLFSNGFGMVTETRSGAVVTEEQVLILDSRHGSVMVYPVINNDAFMPKYEITINEDRTNWVLKALDSSGTVFVLDPTSYFPEAGGVPVPVCEKDPMSC